MAQNADSSEVARKILQEIDTFLFDCDGVLWSTGEIFPGSVELISGLKRLGKNVAFVTNNSTKTRVQCLEKIRGFGIEAELKEIFCTAYTTAQYVKNHLSPEGEVYIVGSPAMGAELEALGVKHHGVGPDNEIKSHGDYDHAGPLNPKVKAVLVGYDGHFNISKLAKAASYLSRENCLFLVTNTDTRYPLKRPGYVAPGTGCILTSVATAVAKQPIDCGKPGSIMYNCVKEEFGFDACKTLMVGDSLESDILFGKNNNLKTMLVMSGSTSHEKFTEVQQGRDQENRKMIPDYFIASISDLGKYL